MPFGGRRLTGIVSFTRFGGTMGDRPVDIEPPSQTSRNRSRKQQLTPAWRASGSRLNGGRTGTFSI